MLSARTITALEGAKKAVSNGYKARKLHKIMVSSPDLWLKAYANIAPNKGALTSGVDGNSLDGFSLERVKNLIQQVRDGTYRPKPVRRVHIPKDKFNPKGKTRPLGVPTGDDKIVQEITRMIVEFIYEPTFNENSHGFRPSRSCHTALDSIRDSWKSTMWICEVDIKGFFDNINHDKLLEILKKRIDDRLLLRLIRSFLEAGYMEDWKWNATYSGTPQGGIISPLLANIYLHELDEFMQTQKEAYDSGIRRKPNREYKRLKGVASIRRQRLLLAGTLTKEEEVQFRSEIQNLRNSYPRKANGNYDTSHHEYKRLKHQCARWEEKLRLKAPVTNEEKMRIEFEIAELEKRYKSLPAVETDGPDFRRMHYIRYADDFLIGITGKKEDAREIMVKATSFLENELKLEVSQEKSGLRAFEDGCTFLGYGLCTRMERKRKRVVADTRNGKVSFVRRSINGHIHFSAPEEKCRRFVHNHGYGIYDAGKVGFRPRKWMINNSEYEIVTAYNAEMRGFANYYNRCARLYLNKVEWIWQSSLIRTLGYKWNHMSPMAVVKRLRQPDGTLALKYKGKNGEEELLKVHSLTGRIRIGYDSRIKKGFHDPDPQANTKWMYGRTELLTRLLAQYCEYCLDEEGPFEVHHIRKMKDIAKGTSYWQKLMIARKRKTLILCEECHLLLHKGTLPDNRFWKFESLVSNGEPDA